jgi:plasmid maintenance system antidote protein VapI
MASAANVLALFGVGLRKSCQIALSRAVQQVQLVKGFSDDEMAEALGCERGTVRNVREQNTLLEFDKIVRLLGKYPDQCEEVRQLWLNLPHDPETIPERRRRLIRELAALEDEA